MEQELGALIPTNPDRRQRVVEQEETPLISMDAKIVDGAEYKRNIGMNELHI